MSTLKKHRDAVKTIEISFYIERGTYDLRASVPGYGTGILDAYRPGRRPKNGYDNFILIWQVIAKQLHMLDDVRHPMVTNKPPRPPYVSKYKGRRLD